MYAAFKEALNTAEAGFSRPEYKESNCTFIWKFKWIVEFLQLENVHGLNCIRKCMTEADNKILSYILVGCTDSGMGKDGTLMQDPWHYALWRGMFSSDNYFISTHKSIYFLHLDKNNNKQKYWYCIHYLTKEESEESQISWVLIVYNCVFCRIGILQWYLFIIFCTTLQETTFIEVSNGQALRSWNGPSLSNCSLFGNALLFSIKNSAAAAAKSL